MADALMIVEESLGNIEIVCAHVSVEDYQEVFKENQEILHLGQKDGIFRPLMDQFLVQVVQSQVLDMDQAQGYFIVGVIVMFFKKNKILDALIIISLIGIIFSVMFALLNLLTKLIFFNENLTFIESINKINEYTGLLFLLSGSIIFILTVYMLFDCSNREEINPFFVAVWKKILIFLPITGMISYHLSLNKNVNVNLNFFKKRVFLKIIYNLSFWGTLFSLSIMLFWIFTHPHSLFIALFFTELILFLVVPISTFLLYLISILDAVSRPQREWEQTDFLKIINPWAWIFGLRKYYYNYLLPTSH